jgi:hypothetical protein
MTSEEREAWLITLRVGDEVACRRGSRFYRTWIITKIAKITPSGRFNLANGTIINPDGSIRGDKYFYIQPVTAEMRLENWRNRAIAKLRNDLKIDKLSNEQLKVLLKMLDA